MSTILYVDDEPNNLLVFESAFEDDFEIHTAGAARQAIEILNSEPIDLLITDQRMPEMTGVQLLEAVSDDFPDMIRMILTGYSDVQAVIQAINSGRLDQYETKPYDVESLRLAMARALERKTCRMRNRELAGQLDDAARRAKGVREVFQRYVPAPVVEDLLSGRSAALVGEYRIIGVLIAELVGFREPANELSAARTLGFLDAYFTEMDRIILDEHGYFAVPASGAEIMALFGVPMASAGMDLHAVATARRMRDALPHINRAHAVPLLGEPLGLRIGVHRGGVVSGNVGASSRMQYGAIGEPIDVANRIMQSAPPGEILISEDVRGFVADAEHLQLDTFGDLPIRGAAEPLRLYRVR
jgi:adenylate cyclase